VQDAVAESPLLEQSGPPASSVVVASSMQPSSDMVPAEISAAMPRRY
jgi:hypothetical protein